MPNSIGVSRRQTVFVVREDAKGVLKFPAAADLVLAAGDAVMNQTPQFTDSEEKRDTLDVLDQFQNSRPPGDWSIPTYLRPSGARGLAPQGEALFETLQGLKNPATSAQLSASLATAATLSLSHGSVAGGALPERGIIQIGSELIRYTGKSAGTLTGLTRGYATTSAATHATGATLSLKSLVFRQATASPSVSIWIKTDHFLQAMAGCTVNQATIGVNNEGAVTLGFKGQGMVMSWAGSDPLSAQAASGATSIPVADARKFCPGLRVWNMTRADDRAGQGYPVTSVDTVANTVTLANATAATWSTGDVLQGFLPDGVAIGRPVESRHTAVEIAGVQARFRNSDYTISVPKQYLTHEVGTDYPEDYLEQTREITSTLNLYFRRDEAIRFHDGYKGSEAPIELVFGEGVGSRMALLLKRCKLEAPSISFENPAVALSMGLKALGTVGEDSCEIRFE